MKFPSYREGDAYYIVERPDLAEKDPCLLEDISGVWVFPRELPGFGHILICEEDDWRTYAYHPEKINMDPNGKWADAGVILGVDGVYFFANSYGFHSAEFRVYSPTRVPFMIPHRLTFERYIRTGKVPLEIVIRVADQFDPEHPPKLPSIEILGVPYIDRYAHLRDAPE